MPELHRLLDSISAAEYDLTKIQLVFVNQSQHSVLDYISKEAGICVDEIIHERCSLSKARNVALQYAKGEIILFPDDDCWYPPELFRLIESEFRLSLSVDGLFGSVYDPYRQMSYGDRPLDYSSPINYRNIYRLPISVGMIIRRSSLRQLSYYFDERYGCGAQYGSGEETDFVHRLLSSGANLVYNGNFMVYHEVDRCPSWRKSFSYGVGFGHLSSSLAISGYPVYIMHIVHMIILSFAGFMRYILNGHNARSRIARIAGIGYGSAVAVWEHILSNSSEALSFPSWLSKR